MTRSIFKNVYLKTRNGKKGGKLLQTRKFFHKFTQKKSEYFCNLNIKDLNDNKKFSKKIKAFFFSDKSLETNKNSSTPANLFSNYFINIASTLKLKQSSQKFSSIPNLLIDYKDNMSIKKIKETYKTAEKFYVKEEPFKEVKELLNL